MNHGQTTPTIHQPGRRNHGPQDMTQEQFRLSQGASDPVTGAKQRFRDKHNTLRKEFPGYEGVTDAAILVHDAIKRHVPRRGRRTREALILAAGVAAGVLGHNIATTPYDGTTQVALAPAAKEALAPIAPPQKSEAPAPKKLTAEQLAAINNAAKIAASHSLAEFIEIQKREKKALRTDPTGYYSNSRDDSIQSTAIWSGTPLDASNKRSIWSGADRFEKKASPNGTVFSVSSDLRYFDIGQDDKPAQAGSDNKYTLTFLSPDVSLFGQPLSADLMGKVISDERTQLIGVSAKNQFSLTNDSPGNRNDVDYQLDLTTGVIDSSTKGSTQEELASRMAAAISSFNGVATDLRPQ